MEVKEVGSESHIIIHCYGQTVCIRGTFSAGNHAKGLIQILPVNVTDFAEGGLRNYAFGKHKEVDNELAKHPKNNGYRGDNVPNGEADSGSDCGGLQKPSKGKQGSEGGGDGKDTSDIQSELDNELKYSRDRTKVAHRSHSGSEQICCSQILLALMVMFFLQMV